MKRTSSSGFRSGLLLLALLSASPAIAQWSPLTNGTPSARGYAALAEDTARGRIVLFGGTADGNLGMNDTWEWSAPNGPWQQVALSGPRPGPRFVHALAYWSNGTNGHIVTFGGWNDAHAFLGDTWTWEGTTWQMAATTGPSARFLTALAPEPTRQRVLLFGGFDGGKLLGDTWVWNGTAWTQLPVAGPSPRSGPAMAHDFLRDRIVLFGGQDSTGFVGDTWEWNGTQWTLASTNGPPPRRDFAMARRGNRVVLFGGVTSTNTDLGDTWEWDGTNWNQTAEGCPPARFAHSMASDASTGAPLMFGGSSAIAVYDDTWRYSGTIIKTNPTNVVANPGQSASFTVEVNSGGGLPAYQWQRNCGAGFQAIAGATNATFILANITANDACLYRAVVQLHGCTATSQAAQLTVNDVACGAVRNEQFACSTNTPNRINYSFDLQNNTGVPAKYLFLVPDTNCFTFTPDIITFKPPLLPGQTTNVSVMINLSGPCASNLCFTLALHDSNLVQCCSIARCIDRTCPGGAPTLNFTVSGGRLCVSWVGNAVLEYTASLVPPINWTPAADQSNPQCLVPTGTQKFFRLRQ